MDVDMSLDDIIKLNKKNSSNNKNNNNKNQRQGGKGRTIKKTGPRGGGSGGNNVVNMKPRKRLQNLGARSAQIINTVSKGGPKNLSPKRESAILHVSNLHFNVSNEDIRELFAEVGQIRKASVHYDKSGRSLGTADVIYSNREAAIRAIKKYHNLPLDGRPMNITLVPSKTNAGSSLGIFKKPQRPANNKPNTTRRVSGGKPPMKGGRQNKPRRTNVQLSAEQLDADLEAYNNNKF